MCLASGRGGASFREAACMQGTFLHKMKPSNSILFFGGGAQGLSATTCLQWPLSETMQHGNALPQNTKEKNNQGKTKNTKEKTSHTPRKKTHTQNTKETKTTRKRKSGNISSGMLAVEIEQQYATTCSSSIPSEGELGIAMVAALRDLLRAYN